MKNILIVEDHFLVGMSLRLVLNEVSEHFNIVEVQNFGDALNEISIQEYDLIILDVYIPGGKGLEMLDIIRKETPNVAILICSSVPEEQFAERFIFAGANGFISKSAPQEEIRLAITTVMNGRRYISEKIKTKLLHQKFKKQSVFERLSPREVEITQLMLEGKWTKEIATALDISSSTVSTFKARIFKKLEVESVIDIFVKVEAENISY